MELSLDPRDLLHVFWRRKWFFVVPLALLVTAAVTAAFTLPPAYRSEATILVEEQDIPENLVPSLVGDYIERRLDILTRRVLGTDNLLRLVERFQLYPDARETMTATRLAERMRNDIKVNILSTEVNDPRSGRSGELIVAFRISFDYHDAEQARRVTNDLVSLFLASNLENRREVATQTASFFATERTEVENRIARVEDELARFKTENRDVLPEEAAFRRQQLANLEQQLRRFDSDLRSLREREGFLTTQIALTEEFEDVESRPGFATTPESQLELLRAELATAQARYSANHPDVIRLRREVRSLESVVGSRAGTSALAEREAALQTQLAALRERYTPEHPDVARAERELASVRQAAASGDAAAGDRRRSSAYVQLSAQLNSIQSEIRAIAEQRVQVVEEREALQALLARAPVVEREFVRLQRELESAIADRAVLADKEASVELSGALEAEAIGERFVLAEPASLPIDPVRPNKGLIIAVGAVFAVGSGTVATLLREMLDRSIRSAADLARIIGETPLVTIPTIESPGDRRRIWGGRVAVVTVLAVAVAGGLVWVNQRVVPLELLGYEARTQVSTWLGLTFPGTAPSPPVQ